MKEVEVNTFVRSSFVYLFILILSFKENKNTTFEFLLFWCSGKINKTMDGDISKNQIKIRIPEDLKEWLVDDWDLITRQQKLALLPAKLTVAQIAENYLAHIQSSKTLNTSQESSLIATIDCLKNYFNKMLGPQLLYKFEKPQYSKTIVDYPGTPMSDIYGSIHLLRLFTRMEPMLANIALDEESLKEVTKYIHQFIKYVMSKRAALFSLLDYGNAAPAYRKKYGSATPAYRRDVYAHPRKAKLKT